MEALFEFRDAPLAVVDGGSTMPYFSRTFLLATAAWLAGSGVAALAADEPTPTNRGPHGPTEYEFFERDVRPVLVNRCFECHGPDTKNESELRLDSLNAMLEGGLSGPAIVPGKPEESLLILAVQHDPLLTAMPPNQKLPNAEIAVLAKWVRVGAPWPDPNVPADRNRDGTRESGFSGEDRSFWAFQPPVASAIPAVRDSAWPTASLDHFVLAQLEANGLKPAPHADRRTLIRRATIDLHGLPPTADEVHAFLADDSPDAFAKLVDRLLASPRYGERWGRHWLDVVRYADSNGMDDNVAYADAWRYRNYVIRAFDKDKPYDQFLREQIAGDLLPPDEWKSPYEGLVATGFLMIGPKMLAEDDPVKQQMDIIDDQIDTIGRAFMGLTLGCARCHDHKFDPISSADYYSLAGIFKSTKVMLSYRVDSKWNSRALGNPALDQQLDNLEKKLDDLGNFVNKEDEKKLITKQLEEVKKEYAQIPKAMSVAESGVEDLHVFLRGNHLTRGELAPRRFPRILAGDRQPPMPSNQSGRRELADWLTRPDHALTSRVMVNRIWQGHFGEGIVRSPDNFGRLGERPDNQALLDWLAVKFVESGWSIKAMHRMMMLSSSYQMSTKYDAVAAAKDPDNRSVWRMNRRRMEAEVIRDSLLAVSGQLDVTRGVPLLGDKVFTILSAADLSDPALYQSNRRSIYLPVLRSGLYDVFVAFDFPDPAVVSGKRANTTVAPQALFMMNANLMSDSAAAMSNRLLALSQVSPTERLRSLYEQAYAREPNEEELAEWLQFIDRYRNAAPNSSADPDALERQIWQAVGRVLLSSNEFVYVE